MWTKAISLAFPQLFSLLSGWLLLTSINLPNNAFRRIIYILSVTDICLALMAIPLTLELDSVLQEHLFVVSRVLFDASFFLSFCLALVAFTIVKLQGTVESIPAIFIICSCLLTGFLHATIFESLNGSEPSAWFWLNFSNASIYTFGFICILLLYILTYQQLQYDKAARVDQSGNSSKSNSSRLYHASDLMMRLIMSLTITNVILWLPIIVCNWVFLDSSPIPSGLSHILYLISLSSKGFFHALSLLVVLGSRSRFYTYFPIGKLSSSKKESSTLPLTVYSQPLPVYISPNRIDRNEVTTILESLQF